MQQPEIKPRHGAVIAWKTEIQKAKNLFVHEEKPQKSVVLAGPAVEGEGKIRRVAQRGQDVPGRGNQHHNQQAAERAKPLPGLRGKQLAGKEEINQPGGHWKKDADEALEQEAQTEVCGQDERPKTWMRFFWVEYAK